MVSVIGEEFLAYTSTTSGNAPALVPLVALFRYDNDNVEMRDLCKQDIMRIPTPSPSTSLVGGWLFRLSQPAESVYNATWVKRFVIIQGEMAFFFHSPSHEKPLSMIPLSGSSVVVPPMNTARFEEQMSSGNTFRANPGFEFDLRHVSRPTIRFCASSGEERQSWLSLFTTATKTNSSSENSRPTKQSHQDAIITNIKLSGLSLLPAAGLTLERSLPPVDETIKRTVIQKSQANDVGQETASIKDEPANAVRQNSFTVSAASMLLLEKSLKKKFNDQEEARRREKTIRSKALSRRSVESAREMEAKNPLSLAELFRFLLFFFDEEFTDDPQQQQMRTAVKFDGTRANGVNIPHIKGVAIENILMFVYQKYCSDTGFMSLEGFVEFMDDCSIIQTHAPRDENDEPLTEFCTLLDAVRLITLVPRNIGVSSSDTYYSADSSSYRYMEAMKKDKFALNFSQFYQLLLRITEIVYPDLYPVDEPYAFNKFLAEVILPLFVWSNGHSKKGAQDVLVREERILLLLITYAPNLWRVFLTYAQDAVGKVPDINELFPERAQANEKGLFKPPPFIPESILGSLSLSQQPHDVHSSSSSASNSLFMSESAFLRCCCDFGLSPHLSSIKQVRATYRQVCARDSSRKVIVSSRLPMPHTSVAASKEKRIGSTVQQQGVVGRQVGKDKVKSAFTTSSKPPPKKKDGAAGSGGERESMALLPSSSAGERSPPPPPPPETFLPNNQIGGLSFSEFCEVLSRVAVEGLGRHPSFEVLFPTPFSKVLAVLTVWGLADISRLEQVRAIHTEELVD